MLERLGNFADCYKKELSYESMKSARYFIDARVYK